MIPSTATVMSSGFARPAPIAAKELKAPAVISNGSPQHSPITTVAPAMPNPVALVDPCLCGLRGSG